MDDASPLGPAAWIGSPLRGTALLGPPAPLLRTRFTLDARPARATLLVTALGVYEAELDGDRIGDELLAPGWTDYRHRLHVQRHELRESLGPGEHVLGVALADGWYAGRVAHFDRGTRWGDRPLLKAVLVLEDAAGNERVIRTSADAWAWAEGPVRSADLIDGEHHDGRREVDGWSGGASGDRPENRVYAWEPAIEIPPPFDPPLVLDDPAPPVRVIQELRPVADPMPGVANWGRASRIFDFGQNFAGKVRLRVRGPRGLTLRLRYSEVLSTDPSPLAKHPLSPDISNLRSAVATDGYTLRGDADGETFVPRFTFHGFRYCEVAWQSGDEEDTNRDRLDPLTRDSLTGLVMANDLNVTGTFETDHGLLNRLHENIGWGLLGNFLEVPTDCPQRDERLGWTGDIQVFAPTACFHRDVSGFLRKWMRDVWDAQLDHGPEAGGVPCVVPNVLGRADGGPGWSDAAVAVPLAAFRAYGDRDALAESWDGARRWVDFQRRTSRDGFRHPEAHGLFAGFGDWLALDGDQSTPFSSLTPKALVAAAYFARSLGDFAEIAALLGHADEARAARADRARAAAAFAGHYLDDGRLQVPSQAAHLFALGFDLLPEPERPRVFTDLVALLAENKHHLSTGFLGTPLLCPVLERFGRIDLALDLLLTETYPGWLYPVTLGATTMWERWNSWHPERGFVDLTMNSLNHYAYGAVGDWIYRSVGGLDFAYHADGPRLRVRPHPDARLGRADTSLVTPLGRIAVSWRLDGETLSGSCVVPAGLPATLELPGEEQRGLDAGEHPF